MWKGTAAEAGGLLSLQVGSHRCLPPAPVQTVWFRRRTVGVLVVLACSQTAVKVLGLKKAKACACGVLSACPVPRYSAGGGRPQNTVCPHISRPCTSRDVPSTTGRQWRAEGAGNLAARRCAPPRLGVGTAGPCNPSLRPRRALYEPASPHSFHPPPAASIARTAPQARAPLFKWSPHQAFFATARLHARHAPPRTPPRSPGAASCVHRADHR